MNAWIYLVYQVVKRVVANTALWSHLQSLVWQAAELPSATGFDKKSWLVRQLQKTDDLPAGVKSGLAATSNWLLNLAIETMVARLKTTGE